jgi:hypothetical protein
VKQNNDNFIPFNALKQAIYIQQNFLFLPSKRIPKRIFHFFLSISFIILEKQTIVFMKHDIKNKERTKKQKLIMESITTLKKICQVLQWQGQGWLPIKNQATKQAYEKKTIVFNIQ